MKKLVTRYYYSMWDIFDLWKTEVSWNEKLDVNPNDNGMGHAFAINFGIADDEKTGKIFENQHFFKYFYKYKYKQ